MRFCLFSLLFGLVGDCVLICFIELVWGLVDVFLGWGWVLYFVFAFAIFECVFEWLFVRWFDCWLFGIYLYLFFL